MGFKAQNVSDRTNNKVLQTVKEVVVSHGVVVLKYADLNGDMFSISYTPDYFEDTFKIAYYLQRYVGKSVIVSQHSKIELGRCESPIRRDYFDGLVILQTWLEDHPVHVKTVDVNDRPDATDNTDHEFW